MVVMKKQCQTEVLLFNFTKFIETNDYIEIPTL